MDIFNIIKKQRHLLFEVEQLKERLNINLESDPMIDDSKSVIDIDFKEEMDFRLMTKDTPIEHSMVLKTLKTN